MTAVNALKIVILWAIAFAAVGAGLGGTLGLLTPDYYRSVV
jgi:hypothetical protein